ncbi:MAG: glycosyltransferase family 39 protein [Anaerolineales bacterium]|nr:glycosyltransferase family 39 protein [Anaerolineales bacterium]
MSRSKIQSKDIAPFFLIFAFLFGGIVRVYPLLVSDFPLADGGMFYSMIQDLQAAHFRLPAFTTYNQAQIPFAYPPLGFYLAGGVHQLTGVSLLSLLRWQPVIVNFLILPFFFFFAKQILRSRNKAALATLIFSLTPNAYWWQIVGGGLTRSLGAFFFLLTALFAERMYRSQKLIWIAATTVSSALTVLSHPEWALQTIVIVFLFWIFYGRNKKGMIASVIVGAGVLLLTAPWWIAVAQQHGLSVFLQAGQATKSRWLFWTIPLTMGFTGESIPVLAVMGVFGLFVHLARKDYLIPTWALLALFADPRGGLPASVFPFSILAATLLSDGVAAQLAAQRSNVEEEAWFASFQTVVGKIFWGTFLIIFFYGAFQISSTLANQSLDVETVEAFQWISANTRTTDRFLILDWQDNPLLSSTLEWFPALTERQSLTTVQGSEWLANERGFKAQMELAQSARACAFQDETCLQKFSGRYEYLFLSLKISRGQSLDFPLLSALENSPNFSLVYSAPEAKIFRVVK